MVNPGTLPLSIIRGTYFPGRILQAKDESVVVTGTLSPDVTGTFIPSGNYNGYPLFILPGAPATFLYYSPPAMSYIIARTLSDSGLTDFWVPSSPLTEPTGTYLGQGAFTGTATATDHPVDLTGYTVEAVVRRNSTAKVTLDLNPSITNAVNGEITIPPIPSSDTEDFDFVGTFRWDLMLIAGGNRYGPYVKGPFVVTDNITQP